MDSISDYLTSYAASLTFQDLPPEVIHQAKRLWVDTLGCAIGGLSSEPARIARDLTAGVSSDRPATILGSGRQTMPDLAAFANGVAIRYMDYTTPIPAASWATPAITWRPFLPRRGGPCQRQGSGRRHGAGLRALLPPL